MRLRFAAFIVAAATLQCVDAASHYIRQGASGANNGTSWTDAYSSMPATMTRGDTYYVADGSYGSYVCDDANSGTSVITIKKATEADHGTETGWSSAYGDGQADFGSITFDDGSGYWVIDGQYRSTLTGGYGFKAYAGDGPVVSMRYAGGNITLKYIDMGGGGPDGDSPFPENDIISTHSSAISNVSIQYSYLHDAGRVHIYSRGGTNWLVEHCAFIRNESVTTEHAESWSCGRTSYVILRHNWFQDTDGTGILCTLDNHPGPTNWEIYGNIFITCDSNNGSISTDGPNDVNVTGTISVASPGVVTVTSHGFYNGEPVKFNTTGSLPSPLVAGTIYVVTNVTTDTFSVMTTSGGIVNTTGTQSGTHTVTYPNQAGSSWFNVKIYNNTFVGGTGYAQGLRCDIGDLSTWDAKNNLWYGNAATVTFSGGSWAWGSMNHDYNAGDDDLGETHDQLLSADPFTDSAAGDYTLESNTTAGVDLGAPYNTDLTGATRTTWTRGAYEYGSEGGDETAPTVSITSPTSGATYSTTASSVVVSGSASDNVGVSSVTGSADTTGSFSITGTTSWSGTVTLNMGANVVTITATDAAANTGTDTITITRNASGSGGVQIRAGTARVGTIRKP